MQPTATDIARSVDCVSVCLCLCVCHVCPVQTAELIEMPFGEGVTHVGPKSHNILDGAQGRTNPFAAKHR